MTNKQSADMADAMNMTMATFQTGVRTLMNNNPQLTNEEQIMLIKIWWDGLMNMIALTGSSNKRDGEDLYND